MEPGVVIDDRFKIVQKIGQGGQGEVFLVQDIINNNSEIALKALRKEFLPKAVERMRKEIEALRSIQSKFVTPIISTNLNEDFNAKGQKPYFVTELAKYGTLRNHNYYNGEISLSLRLFRNLCEGVSDIHRSGIIHRDLKPSNILLVEDEKDLRIGDFGICYIDLEIDKNRTTKIREKVGPLFFAAPEQTSLPPTFTQKSDIYSLGRILYFLITGNYEFSPSEDYIPITVHLGIKEADPIDNLISNMISFDPKGRPGSLDEVIQIIDKLLGNQEPKADLKLSKMQRRIMKYIESDKGFDAELEDILDYLSNFYDIKQDSGVSSIVSPFAIVGKMKWTTFADRVEGSLDQLEKAGLLIFKRGSYSIP